MQLLRPAAKKLTLIDSRRVLSIYEEAIRRVQLVTGLLEQTTITVIVRRLSTSLGVELVDALSHYSSVLDLFDEVVSWREMALCSSRPPVAPPSGVHRVDDRSAAEDSILAMLFHALDDEGPDMFSSFSRSRSTPRAVHRSV